MRCTSHSSQMEVESAANSSTLSHVCRAPFTACAVSSSSSLSAMGNSSSVPFSHEAQLLSDRSKMLSVEVPDAAGNQPANCTVPRRLKGTENGLLQRPYA